MLPFFLVEETTVRESGQSAVFDISSYRSQKVLLTFGITHAVEQESIGIDILGSDDGVTWKGQPVARFTPKSYCGTYEISLAQCEARYLKAVWSVKRWSRNQVPPFFRIFLFARPAMVRAIAVGAA